MNFRSRWFGEVVEIGAINPGDLFVADDGDVAILALKVVSSAAAHALVMRELGAARRAGVPRVLPFQILERNSPRVRRITGDLVVEPINRSPDSALPLRDEGTPTPNGSLAVATQGRLGVYVRVGGQAGEVIDLETGLLMDRADVAAYTSWRLVWVGDDESMELCAF